MTRRRQNTTQKKVELTETVFELSLYVYVYAWKRKGPSIDSTNITDGSGVFGSEVRQEENENKTLHHSSSFFVGLAVLLFCF